MAVEPQADAAHELSVLLNAQRHIVPQELDYRRVNRCDRRGCELSWCLKCDFVTGSPAVRQPFPLRRSQ